MVIVIAEGAGQDLLSESLQSMDQQDASGNKLLQDIGLWLTHKIKVLPSIDQSLLLFDTWLLIDVYVTSKLKSLTIFCHFV